jgi:hypothetical protein
MRILRRVYIDVGFYWMNKPKTMNTDTSWANSPIHQMIQNFESPTPETDASEHDIDEVPAFSFVSSNFARKLERERDELLSAIRNLRDVKGRHHTEQATHKLFGLLP